MRYSGPCLNMGNWSTSLERTRGEKKSRRRRRAPHKDTRAVCRREQMRKNWGRNLLPWHWRIPLTRVSFPPRQVQPRLHSTSAQMKKEATGRSFRRHGKPKKDSSVYTEIRYGVLFPVFFSFSVCCCKKKKWPFYPLDSSPRNLVFSTLFYIWFLFQLHPKETKSLCVYFYLPFAANLLSIKEAVVLCQFSRVESQRSSSRCLSHGDTTKPIR